MLRTFPLLVPAVPLLLLGVPPPREATLTIDEVVFYVLFTLVLVGLAAHAAGLAQGRYLKRRIDAVARAVDAIARRIPGPPWPPGGGAPPAAPAERGPPHEPPAPRTSQASEAEAEASGPSSASEPTVFAETLDGEPPSEPSGSRRIP